MHYSACLWRAGLYMAHAIDFSQGMRRRMQRPVFWVVPKAKHISLDRSCGISRVLRLIQAAKKSVPFTEPQRIVGKSQLMFTACLLVCTGIQKKEWVQARVFHSLGSHGIQSSHFHPLQNQS